MISEFQRETSSVRPEGPATSPSLQESFVQLQQAEGLRQQGRLEQAQAICESLVQGHPDYAGALHTLGLVLADRENHRDALGYLVRAAMLNPRSWTTLTALSGVYLRLGAIEMAVQAIEQARSIEPQDASVLLMLGDILREERKYAQARDAYRQALAIAHDLVPAALGLGWCCADLGEFSEAAEVFEGLVRSGLRWIEPLRALATFPAAFVRIDLLAQLDKVLRDPSESEAEFESSVAFIRSAALDRAGRYAEAWEHAERANRGVFPAVQRSLENLSERRRASLATLRESSGIAGARGSEGPVSLFILGPSRSGKTLMERLVSRLDGVERGFENPIVENTVRRTFQASGLPPDGQLGHLPPQAYPLCREIYREELARRAGSATVFTNTHSGCIFEPACIVSVFENVRFILMKRNLDDNLLRVFLRKYRAGNPYAYDLKAARDHILWYHQMIDLMVEKFPRIVRVIRYEDMITDPATASLTTAELCGLLVSERPAGTVTGDLECAVPYRHFMALKLES